MVPVISWFPLFRGTSGFRGFRLQAEDRLIRHRARFLLRSSLRNSSSIKELEPIAISAMRKIAVPDEGAESLFGTYDENLKHLEALFGVKIRTSGHHLTVEGDA